MDDARLWLFDPTTTRRLVLAHRPPEPSAVMCVVSDVVWQDVVRLLRWATADTGRAAELELARWWRLAAGCADLLRRLPALSDELSEPWRPTPGPVGADGPAVTRVDAVVVRLTRLLRSPDPLPLRALAVEIDALGAAAIGTLAERSSWTVPETR